MQDLPPLRPATETFLNILKHFEGKQINLKEYSLMMGVSRRWVRYMMHELRMKGYVKVIPEHMKIHSSNACRYIFLDKPPLDPIAMVNPEILERLRLRDEDF